MAELAHVYRVDELADDLKRLGFERGNMPRFYARRPVSLARVLADQALRAVRPGG